MRTSIDGRGSWGGNLHVRDAAAGNRILMPVPHDGALFYLGDLHASQGDTEYTGTAADTCGTVRLNFELIKQKRLPFLRFEKPDAFVAVKTARPFEVAMDTATQHLMAWRVNEFGFVPTDAYCLVSTCLHFRINVYQMCNIAEVSRVADAEISRKYLP